VSPKDELVNLHKEVLDGVPDAPLRMFEALQHVLPRSLRAALGAYRASDEELRDASVDAFMAYLAAPDKYDPARGALQTYLVVVARSILWRARKRLDRRESFLDRTVELGAEGVYNEETAVDQHEDPARRLQIEQDSRMADEFRKELSLSPDEEGVLTLMLEGERSTAVFAKVMGVEGLSDLEQRRLVKRCKDKIDKRMARLRSTRDD
jgi:RNA polymerase sigma-70 factor, ECF subfamily